MKKIKLVLILIIFITGGILLNIYFNTILMPAWRSYVCVCIPGQQEKLAEKGFVVAGEVNVSYNTTGEININMNILRESKSTIKHELCHVKQANRYLHIVRFDCSNPVRKYFSEVECYMAQTYPDSIYKVLYGDFEDFE